MILTSKDLEWRKSNSNQLIETQTDAIMYPEHVVASNREVYQVQAQ
jgi:hypothetical protein